MRVLHICPLWFRVGPDAPGGIETLVAALLEQFAQMGCRNTVLAVGGSAVAGQLVPIVEEPLYELTSTGAAWEYGLFEQDQLRTAIDLATEHDVLHSHVGPSAWILSGVKDVESRVLHTLHNPVTPDMVWFAAKHPDMRLATVSRYQARKLCQAGLSGCDVVYNGVDFERFALGADGRRGIVYLGRLSHDKGADIAISVAQALQMPLTMAGPAVDHEFFDAEIRPRLDDRVRYVGVVGNDEKVRLLGGASCVLMPSRWEEGCAMVALEAMACGTPVVGLANGALPEVIDDGVTGYLSSDERKLAELAARAAALDPAGVREQAERRFGIATCAARYLELYRTLANVA